MPSVSATHAPSTQGRITRAKAGVRVRGVFETTGSQTQFSEYGPMKRAGLEVYTDGNRVVELHHIYPAPHSNGLLVAYFPKEKVLFQGDFSLPAAGQEANDHVKALAAALDKLKLDYERYINVHASAEPQTRAELLKAVGR